MIFDMDETLIHRVCSSDKSQKADLYLEVPTEDNLNVVEVSSTLKLVNLIYPSIARLQHPSIRP